MRYQKTILLTPAHHLAIEQQTLAIQPGQYLRLEPHGPISRFVAYRKASVDIVHRGSSGKRFTKAFKQRCASSKERTVL